MNASLVDTMLRNSIGFNPFWLDNQFGKTNNFPPHNIDQIGNERSGNNKYRLTLAVAGYSEDDLKVTLQGEMLSVHGYKPSTFDTSPMNEWVVVPEGIESYRALYRGIASRSFTREFLIGQHVKVDKITLKNGLLQIDLVQEVPEAQRLKEIPISLK